MLTIRQIEKKETIKRLYEEKVPVSEIASRLGDTTPNIYYHIRSMGIYRSKLKKNPKPEIEEQKEIIQEPTSEDIDFSKLPDSVIFKHDKSFIF